MAQTPLAAVLSGPEIQSSMELESEAQEWSCVTFEWKMKGLKTLFESTKGESKSKVARSGKFDNGRWQILFYANSGLPRDPVCPDGYVSLFLSCDPTPEERERGLTDSGRHGWVREGSYKFSFEIRNLERNVTCGTKEATNHTFSSRTGNWGWAQFARRDMVYYNCPTIRSQDAFLIICSVMSSPRPPPSAPLYPYLPAPKHLLDTVGSMLDDPLYSDVQFIFPRNGETISRRIYASKKMCSRADYFATMFSSDFAEGSASSSIVRSSSNGSSDSHFAYDFEDSDEEAEEQLSSDTSHLEADDDVAENDTTTSHKDTHGHDDHEHEGSERPSLRVFPESESEHLSPLHSKKKKSVQPSEKAPPGPMKTVIVVRDVAYRTYKAILYWLYTDHIVFAPLSSSFNCKYRVYNEPSTSTGLSTPAADASSSQPGPMSKRSDSLPATRAEWIAEWTKDFPGRPEPCSAKAVYRVADKIDIPELKERAAQHIIKSLTVSNIAFEVFSPFSAAFEDIRKIEVAFFLNHWHEIKSSECMIDVWRQIRTGRHPGFEEVWPLITQSLEFRPSAATPPTSQPPARYFDNV